MSPKYHILNPRPPTWNPNPVT